MADHDDDLTRFEAEGAPPLLAAAAEGYLDRDGVRVWHASWGAGTPVVLLHGGLGHSGNWGHQVPALAAAGHRVIAVDSRGHGRSSANGAGRGVLSTHLYSDGNQHDCLYVDGGPSSTQTVGHLRMKGREVFRHAVVNLADVVREAMDKNDLTADDIDWFVPHQANKRIITQTARKLGLPMEKVVLTVERHGNTSAASVPLALDEAVRDGRIKQGDMVLLEAMGGGFTWGAALVRW